MSDDVKALFNNPALWIVVLWLAREGYALAKAFIKQKDSEFTVAIQENTKEMKTLAIAMVKLETKFEGLEKLYLTIPEMQKDLSALHGKLRALEDE